MANGGSYVCIDCIDTLAPIALLVRQNLIYACGHVL